MSPTVMRGLSEPYGSWKTICRRARRRRSSAGRQLRPGRGPRTAGGPAVGSIRRSSSRAIVDLPQPDSPTIAKVSPARTSKDTPSTALTVPLPRPSRPVCTGKCLTRPSARRHGGARPRRRCASRCGNARGRSRGRLARERRQPGGELLQRRLPAARAMRRGGAVSPASRRSRSRAAAAPRAGTARRRTGSARRSGNRRACRSRPAPCRRSPRAACAGPRPRGSRPSGRRCTDAAATRTAPARFLPRRPGRHT